MCLSAISLACCKTIYEIYQCISCCKELLEFWSQRRNNNTSTENNDSNNYTSVEMSDVTLNSSNEEISLQGVTDTSYEII